MVGRRRVYQRESDARHAYVKFLTNLGYQQQRARLHGRHDILERCGWQHLRLTATLACLCRAPKVGLHETALPDAPARGTGGILFAAIVAQAIIFV